MLTKLTLPPFTTCLEDLGDSKSRLMNVQRIEIRFELIILFRDFRFSAHQLMPFYIYPEFQISIPFGSAFENYHIIHVFIQYT
jgi:hypothetical protein